MKILVLTYLEKEGSRDYDEVVPQILSALRQGGHQPSVLGVHGELRKLLAGVRRRKPDLIFNLMEMFGDNVWGDVGVVGVLDLLCIPYTGGGPGECFLQEDKGLTKKLLAFDGIRYPDFAIFSKDSGLETGGKLHMPLFVKPLRTDASIGIDAGALCRDAQQMMERVLMIQKQLNDAALVEEYIEGREFYVGVLGNTEPRAFPPIEMDFSGLPDGAPHVLDNNAKWAKGSAEYQGTKAIVADVPEELAARLKKVALDAYRALQVRDYGRIDLRVTEAGEIYVIEVNASCYLEKSGEFVTAAAADGIAYPELVNRIVELALERARQRGLVRRRRTVHRKKQPA
jgi:D-alanine-D-alanine ligase